MKTGHFGTPLQPKSNASRTCRASQPGVRRLARCSTTRTLPRRSRPCQRVHIARGIQIALIEARTGEINEPANALYGAWCCNRWWVAVSQASDDRRQEPRVSVGEVVSLTGSTNGAPTAGQLVNLSPSGALVLPDDPYGIGTVLGLRFELANNQVLQCTAIVRTCLHEQANGVAFLGLSTGDRDRIGDRVRRSAPGGGLCGYCTERESSLATRSPHLASQVENAIRSFIHERDRVWPGAPPVGCRTVA